jgi:glycosyltransferase involved in cell wall biosynthesis
MGKVEKGDIRKQKKALFLGRIYPVKGLPMLIEAWARVRPDGWSLQIAGPDEAGHRAEVEQAVCAAGLAEVISFLGPLEDEAKRSVLLAANLFVLPTHSESFGMAIAEALAHGLPVLTTTGAPWPMLPGHGCGWRVEPTVDGICEGLRQATSLDPGTLQAMGGKGRELVAAEFGWQRVAKQFLLVYENLIGCNKLGSAKFLG